MRLGVISDTHGHVEYTRQGVRMFESLEVDEVLHCGDIGSPDIVPLFSAWPTHFVFGNVDGNQRALRQAFAAAEMFCCDLFGELVRKGRRIAILHGDDEARLRRAIACGEYDLVCHGHTHVARNELHGKTRVLNPGAIYRAQPHSVAVVDLPQLEATIVPLS